MPEESVSECIARINDVCRRYMTTTDPPLKKILADIGKRDQSYQADVLRELMEGIDRIRTDASPEDAKNFWWLVNFNHTSSRATAYSDLCAKLFQRVPSLPEADYACFIAICADYGAFASATMPHVPALVRSLELAYGSEPPTTLLDDLRRLAQVCTYTRNAPEQMFATRISILSGLSQGNLADRPDLNLFAGEAWSNQVLQSLESMQEERGAWTKLIDHCASQASASPSRKWKSVAEACVQELDKQDVARRLAAWLSLVDEPRPDPEGRPELFGYRHPRQIFEPHADILRSFCWIAATLDDDNLTRTLGDLAFSCYKKIPGVGPRAVKIGNAAVNALGQIASETALAQLAMLRVKVKFGTAQKLIESALNTVAEKRGLPREEIEELGVPAYGLTEVGLRREALGDYTCELALTSPTTTELRWIKPDGKPQKSIPAAVKRDFADELKEIKAAAKDIQKMLPAQRDRIDSMFLDRKTWSLATWRERYLDHPLVGVIARRVIWSFKSGDASRSATWLDQTPDGEPVASLVDSTGNPFEPDAKAEVSLWHPIDAERDEILAWRAFFEDRRIRQPFKQAHREVYLLTDAERNTGVYSNRFAAHVLKQHQFNALCAVRNWKNKLRLLVDAEFPPAHRVLPAWRLRAEYWIEGVGDDYGADTNDAGVFNYVVTDQVRFYRIDTALNQAQAGSGSYAMYADPDDATNEPVDLEDIPPIVLSEILRDVDLFVGVASVGNDPNWADGGPEGRYLEYWHDYSFGELSGTATTRRDVLARLVPRLKIAQRCEVGDKFLTVRGDIRTYKIHLGSGNILMEPNDQYLCIVPGQRMVKEGDGKVFLPFEGDRTLAIILSKAFMLADDTKIKDPTIVSQIGRKRQ